MDLGFCLDKERIRDGIPYPTSRRVCDGGGRDGDGGDSGRQEWIVDWERR